MWGFVYILAEAYGFIQSWRGYDQTINMYAEDIWDLNPGPSRFDSKKYLAIYLILLIVWIVLFEYEVGIVQFLNDIKRIARNLFT